MDFATIGGLVIGLVVITVVLIMDGGTPAELFAHPSAILLIIGGSLSATTISYPLSVIIGMPKFVLKAFVVQAHDPMGAIEVITQMADKARREGLLALEEEAKKVDDKFLKKGLQLVVDGTDPAQVHAILEADIEHMSDRHRVGSGFFAAAGGFAPTFGIIGTVMGLISVLKSLDDPNKLATSIAAAFLATLWGLLISNLIYLPLSGKLKVRNEEEYAYRSLLMEGILAMQAGENPRIVREKLLTYLPPSKRGGDEDEKAAAAAAAKK